MSYHLEISDGRRYMPRHARPPFARIRKLFRAGRCAWAAGRLSFALALTSS